MILQLTEKDFSLTNSALHDNQDQKQQLKKLFILHDTTDNS